MPVAEETPVGRLACQRNSSLKKISVTVVSCRPSNEPDRSLVVLSDTVIFPLGGGQPNDLGTVAGLRCVDCYREGLSAVHVVEGGALSAGDTVEVEVDYSRRWDHMQQHSGQHLLSAIAERKFKWDTVAWKLGPAVCYIEVPLPQNPGDPTPEDTVHLQTLEREVNEFIRKRIPFVVHAEDPDHPDHVRPDSLPDDLVGSTVRYVEIDGVDMNPCCGTHVSSTGDLQVVKLFPTVEKLRGGKNVRISFLFGDRVTRYFQECLVRDVELGKIFSTAPESFVDSAARLQKQIKDLTRGSRANQIEIAELTASGIAGRVINNIEQVYAYHRDSADGDFLGTLSRSLQPLLPSELNAVFILSCGTTKEGGSLLVFASSQAAASQVSEVVTNFADALQAEAEKKKKVSAGTQCIKGGPPKNGRYQGKVVPGSWAGLAAAIAATKAVNVS